MSSIHEHHDDNQYASQWVTVSVIGRERVVGLPRSLMGHDRTQACKLKRLLAEGPN